MAKKKPLFWNSTNNVSETIDGTTDTIDESLIQFASSTQHGILNSSDFIAFNAGGGSGGTATSFKLNGTADSTGITAFTGVVIDSNGNFGTGNSSSDTLSKLVGVADAAIAASASGSVVTAGAITGMSGLTANSHLYLLANGTINHTAPTSGYVVDVGYATSTTTMQVNLQPRIKLA